MELTLNVKYGESDEKRKVQVVVVSENDRMCPICWEDQTIWNSWGYQNCSRHNHRLHLCCYVNWATKGSSYCPLDRKPIDFVETYRMIAGKMHRIRISASRDRCGVRKYCQEIRTADDNRIHSLLCRAILKRNENPLLITINRLHPRTQRPIHVKHVLISLKLRTIDVNLLHTCHYNRVITYNTLADQKFLAFNPLTKAQWINQTEGEELNRHTVQVHMYDRQFPFYEKLDFMPYITPESMDDDD